MPTAAQIHALTDRLAALIRLDLNGYDAELGAATVASVASLLDAVGDQDMEGALMPYALAVDRQSLPANYAAVAAQILGRAGYYNLAQQWAAFAQSEAGGSYASFDALLTDAGAILHPLAAELFRFPNNDGAVSAANCFAPNYGIVAPARVYTGADGALVDDTTDALDAGTADVALFANDDECLYLGSNGKFSAFVLGLSTLASVTVTPTFQYWNGSAWATLTVTDSSAGFIKNDVVTFTAPSNWQRCAADGGGAAFADKTPRYYVRVTRTANTVVTTPIATCISLVPAAVLSASGGHLGVPQPPLALVRITGSGALTVVAGVAPDFSRFKAPAIRLRTLSAIGTSPVLTVSYTDQDGNAATQEQSAWATPAALATVDVTLAGGDTGVQGILTSGWVVTSGAQAVVSVEVVETRTLAL